MIRIKKLYELMTIPFPSRRELKKQAKLAKGFMVLIKKKLNRDQLCRSHVFRKLMALAYGLDQEDWLGQLWWQTLLLFMDLLPKLRFLVLIGDSQAVGSQPSFDIDWKTCECL